MSDATQQAVVKLEHANLVVKSLDKTLAFLQVALPTWSVRGRGDSEWFGRKRQWLHFGTNDQYITLNDRAEGCNRDLKGYTPGLAHIGFVVEDLAALAVRLENAGHQIAIVSPLHSHRKSLYFHDPEGFEFEFVQYLSDVPSEKNQYGGELGPVRRLSTN